MSSIKLNGVVKRYGSIEVIPELDLAMAAGEFVVLVGPSGCGKSTLLRMIAGLEKCSDGTISIGDRVVNRLDASKRGIAMVFQTYALYPHMTVRENVGFGLKMMRRDPAEISARVEEVAQTLRLDTLLDRRPKDLSGGQRQRVAIGRAIVRDPDVFLFDEPLSNLDAELRVEMRLEIADLHKRLGATMVYVTHDQVEAMTLADKIAVMRNGRIEQFGAPRELFSDPANAFVAGFIGAPKMNFVRATLVHSACDHSVLRTGDGVDLVGPALSAGVENEDVLVGIRPQKVTITPNGAHEVVAEHVEALGTGTNIFGRWQGLENFTITLPSDVPLDAGSPIRFDLDATDIFVFAPGSGERIR